MQGISIPMPCTRRVFPISYGNPLEFFYTEPPQYDGVEYREEGVPQCRVKMTIPQHPFHS
jgi:hypothetical protein